MFFLLNGFRRTELKRNQPLLFSKRSLKILRRKRERQMKLYGQSGQRSRIQTGTQQNRSAAVGNIMPVRAHIFVMNLEAMREINTLPFQ